MTFRLLLAVLFLLLSIPLIIAGHRSVLAAGRAYGFDGRRFGLVSVGLGVVFLALSTVRVVNPGTVGIPILFGKVQPTVGNGIHVVNPLSSIVALSVRTEEYTMTMAEDEGAVQGDDAVNATSSDGANLKSDATILFHLDQRRAGDVYRNIGSNYAPKIIRPVTRTAIRDVFAGYLAEEIYATKRLEVAEKVETEIRDALEPRGIEVETFLLRKVALPEELQKGIDAKLSADQEARSQQFKLEKAKQEAEIKRVEARGIADSQAVINDTLTPAYLQYLYIQSLGSLVNAPNNSTVILPFDQKLTPLLNIPGATPAPN